MNYILNNKMKFEKNKYNKPVNPRIPIVLMHTKIIKIPLKLETSLPTQTTYYTPSVIDFKLKDYQMNQTIIKLNQDQKSHSQLHPQSHSQSESQIESQTQTLYYKDNELIVNIYGEVSFDKILYDFLLELSKHMKVKIYIHTWNVDKSKLDYYFQGLNVISLIVDNSELESDISDISGNIFSSNETLKSWKLMWTSMYRSMNEIYKREDNTTVILNTKFNINYNFNYNDLIRIIQNVNKFTKNIFLKDSTDLSGVDNPIIGDKDTLQKLIHIFYNNLDDVSMFYKSFKIPEAAIYYENNRIFGVNINNMFENIDKYSK